MYNLNVPFTEGLMQTPSCSIVTQVITYFQLCTLSYCSIHTKLNVLLIRTLCVVVLFILTLCAIFNLSIFVYIKAVFVLYLQRDNICESEFNNTYSNPKLSQQCRSLSTYITCELFYVLLAYTL